MISVYTLADRLAEVLRNSPLMGCDCCSSSATEGLHEWANSGDDLEDRWDFVWNTAEPVLFNRLWLIALDLAAEALGIHRDGVTVDICLCSIGVQECPVHPGRLLTKEEKIAFRREWDARVDAGKSDAGND